MIKLYYIRRIQSFRSLSKTTHTLYLAVMTLIVIATTAYLSYVGYSYYSTPFEERFYHPQHDWFKPSGAYGHGLGIIGTLLILIGVVLYIARKRYNFLGRVIRLKYLLEFHIFLCSLGPVMVLFHTAFKFGGIVSVAFWSMVAVVASGVAGRFIYIQIPRSIEGRALTLGEVKEIRETLSESLRKTIQGPELAGLAIDGAGIGSGVLSFREVKTRLGALQISRNEKSMILKMIKAEKSLSGKINRLEYMKKLFQYWHVAHLPFALIMLIIVVIHVAITLAFGYTWVF